MIVLANRGPNSPAHLLAARCADQGYFIPVEVMHGAIEQVADEASIEALSAALADALHRKFDDRPVLNNWAALLDYLKAKLVALQQEEVRVLFLDSKNHLIADEAHNRGTIDECPLHVRNLIHRALDLGAAALILAHNHPSGDPTPSHQDIHITRNLIEATKHLRITIHDHIIVGGSQPPVSMRSLGHLS
jgi:DNA repair protein RadC